MTNHLKSLNSSEKKYSYKIMDQQMEISLYSSDISAVHRKKFDLISELVKDLFKHRNKQVCVKSISNLIISTLISSDENSPLDIYNIDEELEEEMNEECRNILERELFRLSNDLPN
ncbi:MAG: hypothetical protein KGD57_05385 [Candidatus Lokiarchaeota archaeon]|nr:hypothetical protein [Candidatus Lokiarchaeota archaeon]